MSPWAATTKYNRVGGLNSRHLFLTVLEVVNYKTKVLINSDFGEDKIFLLAVGHPLCILTW
jgi:hypothetical protein